MTSEEQKQFRSAREFMDELRARQAASGQTLKGRPGLQPVQRMAIRATAVSYVVAGTPPKIEQADMIKVLERFEEMARRHKMIIDAGLRPYILNLLITELWTNKHSLNLQVDKIVAATAYQGAIGVQLAKEFPQFSDTPNLYRHAVVNYPAASRDFLRMAKVTLEKISMDKEFAEFSQTPGIYKQAVVRNPSDPWGFLRNVQNTMASMAREDEFMEFWETPGIFKQAVISNPSDPREYIRKMQLTISDMSRDPEFSSFTGTPGIFLQAVMRNPSDPKALLRKIKMDVSVLSKEKEFIEFHDKPSILQHAAVHNPSDPRAFLRKTPKAMWHAMLVKKRQALKKEKEGTARELPRPSPKKPK